MKTKLAETIRKQFTKKNTRLSVIPFVFGWFIGFAFSQISGPLLHYLLYKDMESALTTSAFISVAVFTMVVVIFGAKPVLDMTRKKACKALFTGIAFSSFVLGFGTFITYPSILASDYSWLTEGINIYFLRQYVPTGRPFIDATLGGLIFFIASILWDALIGSFFAVLEHLLT